MVAVKLRMLEPFPGVIRIVHGAAALAVECRSPCLSSLLLSSLLSVIGNEIIKSHIAKTAHAYTRGSGARWGYAEAAGAGV